MCHICARVCTCTTVDGMGREAANRAGPQVREQSYSKKAIDMFADLYSFSIGEYAAMVIGQVLELRDALLFVARRAALMKTKCQANATGMLACRVSSINAVDGLDRFVRECADVSMACQNSPQDFVVAGPIAAFDAITDYCNANNIKSTRLPVNYGFHSPAMNPILGELAKLASGLKIHPSSSQVRYGSALYGRLLAAGEEIDPEYLVRHTRETVNFSRLVEEVRADSDKQFMVIEIGPSASSKNPCPAFSS